METTHHENWRGLQTQVTTGCVRQNESIQMLHHIRCIIIKTESWKFCEWTDDEWGSWICWACIKVLKEWLLRVMSSAAAVHTQEPRGEIFFLGNLKKKTPPSQSQTFSTKGKHKKKKICLQHNLLRFFLTGQSVQSSSLTLLYVEVSFMSDHVFIQKFPQTKPLFVFFLLVINQNQKCKKYNHTLLL